MTKERITYLAKDKDGRYYICIDTDKYNGVIHSDAIAKLFYEENKQFGECEVYEYEEE